jgi:hypothetical protein
MTHLSVIRVFLIKQYMFTKDKEIHLHVVHTAWWWWKGIHPAHLHYWWWKGIHPASPNCIVVVERDTSCTSILHSGGGKGYILHIHTA